MGDKQILDVLRTIEWSGPGARCPYCKDAPPHDVYCRLIGAIRETEKRAEMQAACDLIAGDFGCGQVITMPTEPRVYGLWGGKSWWQRVGGEIIHYSTRQAAAAELRNGDMNGSEVREIGTDGLPVPESE